MSHPSGDPGAHAVDCRVVNILSCRNWMNQPWLVNLGGSPQTMIIRNSNANGYFTWRKPRPIESPIESSMIKIIMNSLTNGDFPGCYVKETIEYSPSFRVTRNNTPRHGDVLSSHWKANAPGRQIAIVMEKDRKIWPNTVFWSMMIIVI